MSVRLKTPVPVPPIKEAERPGFKRTMTIGGEQQ